ncbi:MAG: sigma-70 family RNA polymerase sigma factor [Planctomycetes bacterium]|nr:sigma-70 family RNA polymerase sigma factor [Planctomycetota bacterium]
MKHPADHTPLQSPRGFRTTHWSLVVSASADSREALEELCAVYWPPLFSYVRRLGYNDAEAEDLTQAFFTRLLDKRLLALADRDRGRFRTFLLTALRRFVVNEWKHQTAEKRGGATRHFTLSTPGAEQLVAADVTTNLTPDRLFERNWALVVLQRALDELESEQRTAGKGESYRALVPYLIGDADVPGYDAVAKQLGSTSAALRMLVVRNRKRLGELIRCEIRKTVGSDADVDEEVGQLFRSLQS